jgi:hypothetical protein
MFTKSITSINLTTNIKKYKKKEKDKKEKEKEKKENNTNSITTNIDSILDIKKINLIDEETSKKNNSLFDLKKQIHQIYFHTSTIYHRYTINGFMNKKVICIYNVNDIWNLFIESKYNLSNQQLKSLIDLCNNCKNEWISCLTTYNTFLIQENNITSYDDILKWISLFKNYESIGNTYLNLIINLCSEIKSQIINNSSKNNSSKNNTTNYSEKSEKGSNGLEWFNFISQKYIQYGGIFPTTTKKFILFFKNNWDNISDLDTIYISDILLINLGGTSLEYNSYCLYDFITKNIDCIPNIKNWIL